MARDAERRTTDVPVASADEEEAILRAAPDTAGRRAPVLRIRCAYREPAFLTRSLLVPGPVAAL
jgi:hypothetical protein